MLYKRICGGRSSRNSWSMGRQRCMRLFCQTWTRTPRQKRRSVCQHHVTAQQCRAITANDTGCIRLQLCKWERQKKRRLIGSGPRCVLLYVHHCRSRPEGDEPRQNKSSPLHWDTEDSAVDELQLHPTTSLNTEISE